MSNRWPFQRSLLVRNPLKKKRAAGLQVFVFGESGTLSTLRILHVGDSFGMFQQPARLNCINVVDRIFVPSPEFASVTRRSKRNTWHPVLGIKLVTVHTALCKACCTPRNRAF